MKLLYSPLVLLLLLASCKKDDDQVLQPAQPPAAISQLSRIFYYPVEKSTILESYTEVDPFYAFDDKQNLVLDFDLPYPPGKDNVTFVIDRARIQAGITGKYEINMTASSGVAAYYQYRLTANSANRFLPGNSSGSVTITRFDKRWNTISGNYSFKIYSINDPLSASINNFKQTEITINGSFEHVGIKAD